MGSLVLVKHAMPILDASKPPKEWVLGPEGRAGAEQLGNHFKDHYWFDVVYSSEEPKALETAQIVAKVLQVPTRPLAELNEIDRRAMPIMSREEHVEYNRELFVRRHEKVVGEESAEEALDRFEFGINLILLGKPENVLVISHGTVISLYAQKTNRSLFAFGMWQKMNCLDYLDLGLPDFDFKKLHDFGANLVTPLLGTHNRP